MEDMTHVAKGRIIIIVLSQRENLCWFQFYTRQSNVVFHPSIQFPLQ
jgi:hypothetical protein